MNLLRRGHGHVRFFRFHFFGSSLQIVLDAHAHKIKFDVNFIMGSAIDAAKRALVALLRSITAVYGVTLSLTRESTESEIRNAFRKVSKDAHPDHAGKEGCVQEGGVEEWCCLQAVR